MNRENMMRKGVRADTRYDLSAIVFEGEAGKPLSEKSRERFGKALEHVRWAPSAVNKQPWRMIVKDETVFFYEKPDRGFVSDVTGDLQKIDVGIAMYHFVAGMGPGEGNCSFLTKDPKLTVPDEWQYVAGIRIDM